MWLMKTLLTSGCTNQRGAGQSGTTEISQQDKHVTQRIAKALALVEVRVLDHLVVGNEVVSFAECGLL